MIVLEFKLKGRFEQFHILDEMIRAAQFVRNKALRFWIDNHGTKPYDLNKYCKVLADNPDFPWAKKLNSQARQSSAERAAYAIQRFFANCKDKKPGLSATPAGHDGAQPNGKKGYPQFQKNNRSVEYKTTGWKLSEDKRFLTFTDGFNAGRFKLIGTRDLHFYQEAEIKRLRVVRRADGYYAQLCIEAERNLDLEPTGRTLGIDMGLNTFYTDSAGVQVDNPRFLRKAEQSLKRLQRGVSKKKKGSKNRIKARKRLARKHLKVSRQRKDHAVKTARALILSNDVVVYEKLQVRNMVRNHCLAKSISDASWSLFAEWLEYFGKVFGRITIAVNPAYTSQECSNCRTMVVKSLSTRTHICRCGCVLDRDENAAINILQKGLCLAGRAEKQYPGALGNLTFAESLAATGLGESLNQKAISVKQESQGL
jgi:putative transposase